MVLYYAIAAVLILGVVALLYFSFRGSVQNKEEKTLSRKTLICLAILIPSIAFILYRVTGAPHAIEVAERGDEKPVMMGHQLTELEQLVDKLARRLEKEPEDLEGWALLARSYNALGYSDKAQAASARATQLETKIHKLENATPTRISGVISLDPSFKKQISQSDVVYVFAKEQGDKRPPIAAVRLFAKELPAQFVLDDTFTMLPDRKLSSFSEVVVEARVSKSGNPVAQVGDLEGSVSHVKVGSENVRVVIDHK